MIYNAFARALRRGYRWVHPRWRVDTSREPAPPSVYVVHHQNMFGPVHAIGLLPEQTHIWTLHVFCEKDACFDQFYHYTFLERYGWPKLVAYPLAKLLSFFVPYLMRSLSAIAVHHDMQIVKTMRASTKALARGESLTICPDVNYADDDASVGQIYTGFLLLARAYVRQAGEPLRFVPTYCSRKAKRIVFGDPLTIDPDQIGQETAVSAIAKQIQESINLLGRACGDIAPETAGASGGEHAVVKTERLCMVPQSVAEMTARQENERDPGMKQAYGEMLKTMKGLPGREGWGTEWKITLASGETIGGACFKGGPDGDGKVEIGYGIDEPYRRNGYATEAVQGMVAWALAQDGVHAVIAQTEEGNETSQRVLLRSGFARDGEGAEGPQFIHVRP